jgi:hypothetical protein
VARKRFSQQSAIGVPVKRDPGQLAGHLGDQRREMGIKKWLTSPVQVHELNLDSRICRDIAKYRGQDLWR